MVCSVRQDINDDKYEGSSSYLQLVEGYFCVVRSLTRVRPPVVDHVESYKVNGDGCVSQWERQSGGKT